MTIKKLRLKGDSVQVRLDRRDLERLAEWLASERVGFDHMQSVSAGQIRLLLEKDFACIDRPPATRPTTLTPSPTRRSIVETRRFPTGGAKMSDGLPWHRIRFAFTITRISRNPPRIHSHNSNPYIFLH